METTQHRLSTSATTPPLTAAQPGVSGAVKKDVEFLLAAPQAHAVSVAGTFNHWDPKRTPMKKRLGDRWRITISLAPGRYEYRFVVDGCWVSDPKAKQSVTNTFGSTNSVIVV